MNGALALRASNACNTDISTAVVGPNSAARIASIGAGAGLHADFGAGQCNGARIGIPHVVVSASPARVAWAGPTAPTSAIPAHAPCQRPRRSRARLTRIATAPCS
ncbi:MAG: hypothetical protein H7306_02735 [Bacteriovorax sp.]|nr:hypothetical protein [Rhizobacter sp.]